MQVSQVRNICFALIAMLCAGGISLTAYGQTAFVYVNIDREWPSNDPEDGESWETAYRFLQDGLDKAEFLEGNPQISTVEIWVAQGTYRPDQRAAICGTQDEDCPNCGNCDREATFNLRNNIGIYGGFSGEGWETEREDRDWELNPTILSGDLKGDDNVLIYNQAGELVLEFNNFADNSYAIVRAHSDVVLPVVTDSTLCADAECSLATDVCECTPIGLGRCNACPDFCISCVDSDCEGTTINNTAVLDGFHIQRANVEPVSLAQGEFGSAVSIVGASPTIRNCIIRENQNNSNYVDGVGIAIALPIPQQITIQNVTVQHNRADRDDPGHDLVAGMWIGDRCLRPSVQPGLLPRQVVLLGVEIAENLATTVFGPTQSTGGGLFVSESIPVGSAPLAPIEVTVVNSSIYRNVKYGFGSGIDVGNHSNLRLWNSLLHDNHAKDVPSPSFDPEPGRGAIVKRDDGQVEIINSTIADNTAETGTGGLHLNRQSGDPSDIKVRNTIFWGNTYDSCSSPCEQITASGNV